MSVQHHPSILSAKSFWKRNLGRPEWQNLPEKWPRDATSKPRLAAWDYCSLFWAITVKRCNLQDVYGYGITGSVYKTFMKVLWKDGRIILKWMLHETIKWVRYSPVAEWESMAGICWRQQPVVVLLEQNDICLPVNEQENWMTHAAHLNSRFVNYATLHQTKISEPVRLWVTFTITKWTETNLGRA